MDSILAADPYPSATFHGHAGSAHGTCIFPQLSRQDANPMAADLPFHGVEFLLQGLKEG